MRVFCTSDTHFGHKNIIKYCNRPFLSIEEHDATIVANWNEIVTDDDVIVHMGDLTMLSRLSVENQLHRQIKNLNGRKILVAGNHDSKHVKRTIEQDFYWKVFNKIETKEVLFRHWPLGPNEEEKLCVHGHSHGKLKKALHVDVGVDVYSFKPVLVADVLSSLGCQNVEQTINELLEFCHVK